MLAECIGVPTPDVLYRGPLKGMNLNPQRSCRAHTANPIWPHASTLGYVCEGYVIRTVGPFPVHEFSLNVRKYVRPGHVTTDEHWLHGAGKMRINQLRETLQA